MENRRPATPFQPRSFLLWPPQQPTKVPQDINRHALKKRGLLPRKLITLGVSRFHNFQTMRHGKAHHHRLARYQQALQDAGYEDGDLTSLTAHRKTQRLLGKLRLKGRVLCFGHHPSRPRSIHNKYGQGVLAIVCQSHGMVTKPVHLQKTYGGVYKLLKRPGEINKLFGRDTLTAY